MSNSKRFLSRWWLLLALLSLAIVAVGCGSAAVHQRPAGRAGGNRQERRGLLKRPLRQRMNLWPRTTQWLKMLPSLWRKMPWPRLTPLPRNRRWSPVVNPGKRSPCMDPDFSTERFDRLWTAGEGANAYMAYLHSALVESDADRKQIPGIASEWSINEDGSSYSFKIRQGVKFHDGSELTPADVLWTYQHSFGPQASEYAIGSGYLKAAKIADTISLTEPDVLTISFTGAVSGARPQRV